MAVPKSFSKLVDSAVAQTTELAGQLREHTSDQIARLSGRAAGWVDQAGAAAAEFTEHTAHRYAELGQASVEAAGHYTKQASTKLSQLTITCAEGLSERLVEVGERLSRHDD